MIDPNEDVRVIDMALLEPPDDLNRRHSRQYIEYIAANISKHGLLHPITVIPVGEKYRVEIGGGRCAAMTMLGWSEGCAACFPLRRSWRSVSICG